MIINNIHISDFAQTVLAEFRGNTMSSMAPAPCSLGRSMAPASNQHQPTRNHRLAARQGVQKTQTAQVLYQLWWGQKKALQCHQKLHGCVMEILPYFNLTPIHFSWENAWSSSIFNLVQPGPPRLCLLVKNLSLDIVNWSHTFYEWDMWKIVNINLEYEVWEYLSFATIFGI